MKHSSWFRFGLIVLCIAMAMSMFACGGGKDETTEKPGQETTEKPTEQTTEKPTETPTKETTEAPTKETTEAPTTETTEAPTTETTEAPTTETTEAPTTETTEAPTTETTEAPTTETTETPTTETTENPNAEIIEKIPVFFGKEELQAVTPNDGLYAEPTDDGMYFINDFNMDGNFTLFSKRAAEQGATGQYLFIKYKASENTAFTFYTSTVNGSPAYQNEYGMKANGDEQWHFLILDMSKQIPSFVKPAEDGQYYIQHLRIDIEGGEGIWAEIAYVGYAANVDDIVALVKAFDPEIAEGFCPCGSILAGAEYTDKDTHAATCKLCGKSVASAHVGASAGAWDAELGYYVSNAACTVCGQKYDFACVAGGEGEDLFTALTQWNITRSLEDGFVRFKANTGDDTLFKAMPFGINPTNAAGGRYMVMKYRVTSETATAIAIKYASTGETVKIDLISDGEWHIVVTELATDFTDGDVRLLMYYEGASIGWTKGDTFDVDWVRLYQNMDSISGSIKGEIMAEETGKLNTFFGKDYLMSDSAKPNDGLYAEPTDNGVLYTNDFNMDGNFTLFQKRPAEDGPTGQYFFIKYRASEKATLALYTSTTTDGPAYGQSTGFAAATGLETDEGWKILIADISTLVPNFAPAEDGQYYVKHLRLDIEGGEGIWMEIAYLGYTDDLDELIGVIKAIEGGVSEDACRCNSFLQTATYSDKNTHAATCKLCGSVQNLAHEGGVNGVWNAELGYYESGSACAICGQKYDFGANLVMEAEDVKIAEPGGWNTYATLSEDGTYISIIGKNPGWSACYFPINPKGAVSGRYLVFKYRFQHEDANQNFWLQAGTGGNVDYKIPMTIDGEWHIAVVDLAANGAFAPNENGEYIITNGGRIILNHLANYPAPIELDYFRMYDSIDRMPKEYQDIINPPSEDDTTEKLPEETTEKVPEETTEKAPVDNCEHEAGAELDVYEVVGDGSGLEYYATCAKCGEKVTRPISVWRNHWDNTIGADESVSCGVGFCGGWSVITGGILEYRFVLTNANDPTETATIVVAITGENGGVKNAAPAKYGENRGFSGGKAVNVADWSNVEGVDFTGDDVTITIYAVSKADPEADPILLEADLGPVKPAHSVVAGAWVEATQQYQGMCGCGSITDQVMDANIYFEAEKLTIGGVWNSGQRVETDGDVTYAWVQSNNAAGGWCNTYFQLNPAQAVSGQYLVFRYRAPAAVTNNTLVILTDANSGYTQTVNVELTIDNEWHIVIIDLAEYGFNAESVFSNNSRLNLTPWGAGEYIQFDWFRIYDSYDHIPADYKPAA